MNTTRILILALALIMSSATTTVAQQVDDKNTDSIVLLLSGFEYFPTRTELEAVTPEAASILVAISQDKSNKPSLRLRAIDALGLFNNPVAAQHFEASLAQGKMEEVYLRHSITASLKAFGQTALPWVHPYIDHNDPNIRLDAAHAITRFGGADGLGMIRARQRIEQDPFVRSQLIKLDP